MTVKAKRFALAQLAAADAAIVTGNSNVTTVIKRAVFSNTDSAAHTITLNVVASGGSSSAANQVVNARALAAGETYVSPELAGVVLSPGDMIRGLADAASKVTVTVSGVEIS